MPRSIQDPNRAIGGLQKKVKDNISTVNSRLADVAATASRKTGRVECWMGRTSPPPEGALLLNGATVNRADYPDLWQWVVDQGTNGTWFGNGNGSTTFVLPNSVSNNRPTFVGGNGTTYYSNWIIWT